MLFIAERLADLTATREELLLLCAIANGLDSAKTIAIVMIETFIVIFSFLLLLYRFEFLVA
jgi:hypothetical protein